MLQRISSFLFENQSIRQKILKNTFWLFAGEIIGRILRAVIIIYAARVLGVAEYGVFSYAVTLAAFFSIFSDIGISAILTREGVRSPELRGQYLSTSFVIKLALTGISAFLVLSLAPFLTAIHGVRALLPLVTLLLVFDSIREFGISLNRIFEQMEREAFIKIIVNGGISILGILFLLKSQTSMSLATAYVIGSGLSVLVTAWVLRAHLTNLLRFFKKQLVRPILFAAWPFGLMGILGGIMINTDMLMIGWLKDAYNVGLYSAAQRPVQLLYTLPALLAGALFPTFARLAKKENEKFREALEKSVSATILIALPMAFGGIVLGNDIIRVLFGTEYLPGALSFQILLLTLIISFPATLIANALFAYDEQKSFTKYLAIGAIGNAVFNYFLIIPFGIAGCAIATVITQCIANSFAMRKMKRVNPFSILPHLPRIILATLLMGIGTFIFQWFGISFWVNLLLSTAIYGGVLLFFKEPLFLQV